MNSFSPSATLALQPVIDTEDDLDSSKDLDQLIYLVIDTVQNPHTKLAYRRALQDFLEYWIHLGKPTPTKAFVQHYISHLLETGMGASSVAQRLVAIRRLFGEAADNGFILYTLAIPISRVKGPQVRGQRIGNWLTLDQAEALLNAPDSSILKGKRDQAILAILIGAGLRRQEVVDLTVEHLQIRENRWVIVDLIGKRRKVRSIPIPH
jgi:site-specific recombinase XerD